MKSLDNRYFELETHRPFYKGDMYEKYDDMLDTKYPNTTVAGQNYRTSTILENIHPARYEKEFKEWIGNYLEQENGKTLIDRDTLFNQYEREATIKGVNTMSIDEKMELYDEFMDETLPCTNPSIDYFEAEIEKFTEDFDEDVIGEHKDFVKYLYDACNKAYDKLADAKEGMSDEVPSIDDQEHEIVNDIREQYLKVDRALLIDELEKKKVYAIELKQPKERTSDRRTLNQDRWSKAPSKQQPEEDDTQEAKKTARFKR